VSKSGFFSVAYQVAARNVRQLLKKPLLLISVIAVPMLFFIAFAGALGNATKIPGFGSNDYDAFQYVFSLMQAAAFIGVSGGTAMVEDFQSGFMDRLMVAAPRRFAIVVGFVAAVFVRTAIAAAALTGVAIGLGMNVKGSALDLLGLYGLAVLLNLTAALFAAGVAMKARSPNAAPAMILPMFILLFLAPVFLPLHLLTGWLHSVARFNPLTQLLEAGRSLISGTPAHVGLGYGVAGAMLAVGFVLALWGVRSAERAD
jgi:ABC-2 type transport system permease protein